MTPDAAHLTRIRRAIQKVHVAQRILREARLELKHAVDAAITPTPGGDGERKSAAA